MHLQQINTPTNPHDNHSQHHPGKDQPTDRQLMKQVKLKMLNNLKLLKKQEKHKIPIKPKLRTILKM